MPLQRHASLLLAALALGGCGTEFTACREGEPCKVVSTTTGGSGGTGGSAGTGAGGSTGGSAAGGRGGTLVVTSTSGGVAGEAGAPGAAGAPDTTTSGGTGGTGTGGTGGNPPVPCDGACGGTTPVCDEATDSCVECLETGDCDAGVCDTDAHLCVECLEAEDCEAPTPLCDTEDQLCVECLNNTDCTDAQASFCDAGSCTRCRTNDDCAHLVGATVCDAGQCVQCTVAEEASCDGKSCNPATRACTETDVGSVSDCGPCLADSECAGGNQSDADRRCVPMEFQGERREGGVCFMRRAKVEECPRPFVAALTAPSLSGASEEVYCGIDQATVTCEAVLDLQHSRTCTDNTECGCPRDEEGICTAPGKGGLCRDIQPANNRCTYQCGVTDECPGSLTCNTQPNPDFCY